MSKPTETDPITMAICSVESAFDSDVELDDTALGVVVVETLDIVDEAMTIPS